MTAVSTKKLAIRGAIWTIGGYGIAMGLRLANNLILTRLLVPEFFGLMAFTYTLRMGIELFSDFGIAQSIINHPRGEEPEFLDTAWSLQILRGFQVWGISLLLTYPVAMLYGNPQLYILIPLVCLSAVCDGFSSPAMHVLNRRLELKRLTIYELVLQVIALSILVVLCWASPTIWSLAIGGMVGAILNMICSHWLLPGYQAKLRWDQEFLKDLRNFGKWMALASALMFLAEQCDRILLAKLLSWQQFGVYTIAYTLAVIPREVIRHLSHRVIFPAISSQLDLPRLELRAKILKQRWLILIGSALIVAVMVSFGDWIITLMYQHRNQNWSQYQAATWMVPILSVGVWFSVMFYSSNPALIALSKPVYSAQANLARFVVIAGGMPLAYYFYGVLGAIAVVSFSDFPLYVVNLIALKKEKLDCAMQDFLATIYFAIVLGGILLVRYALGYGLPIQTLF
jgi:O-antigen/teichoic acid export membrane protein